ncbi:hypothetical protein AB4Z38_21850 [Arthrobacter sp. 2RAF6]|uniref:hypothetical protein n=1 Tax=Arthrobacter sp. 2RAF6 TaxID=3233002 RepID=UPI003F8EF88B
MVSEIGKKDEPASKNDAGVERRRLLRLGTLITAFTGASAISALGASSAKAASVDKYVPEAEKGAPSGVAALDVTAKIPPTQIPDLSATYAPASGSATYATKTELPATVGTQISTAGSPANVALAKRSTLNILDFGVVTGTASSQTAAITAALYGNPGKAFYFPPGDYRLDTGLIISQANSLRLDDDARLYAGAAMTTMITYLQSAAGYAEDKALTGGLLDGNLKAQRILSIGKVIRFTLTRTNFKDGINRGLVTEAGLGAEVFAYDLRFYNSGISNVTDNIAIEANMGDSHFRDIVIRDWTTAVKDTSANRWDRVHPWISQDSGAVTQMASRYPTSIGFDLTGSSDLQACVADTYRYAYKFRTNGTGYTPPPRLLNCRAMWANDPILPTALATANPAYVLDNTDGIGVISDRLTTTGHTTAPGNFLTGPTTNLITRRTHSYGYIKGNTGSTSDPLDYINGILNGTFSFTPTIYGSSNAGTHTYNSRSGRMVVNGDEVTYYIRINATLDATTAFAGAFRVGGIPLPPGATNVRDGAGVVGYCTNVQAATVAMFAGTAPYVTILAPATATGTAEVDIPGQSLRGKTVDVILAVTVTHFKP